MKKLVILALCTVLLFALGGCGKDKNNADSQNPSISDIPTAEADKNKSDSDENGAAQDSDKSTDPNDSEGKSSNSDKSRNSVQNNGSGSVDTSDRTAASDKTEIQNNIRDAQELIDDGLYDDAKAIIRVLRSRKLSSEEEKMVDELEKKMLSVSD